VFDDMFEWVLHWLCLIHLGGVKERRKRDEHVLGAQHVPVDRYAGNVAEINWRYHQKFDSARRSSLGRVMHLPSTTIVFLWMR